MLAKTKIPVGKGCPGAGRRTSVIRGAGRAYLTCPTCGKHLYFGTVDPKDTSGKRITAHVVPQHLPKRTWMMDS